MRIDIPNPTVSIKLGLIKPGVLFLGGAESKVKLHLKLEEGMVVNLETFRLWKNYSPDLPVYNYKEITDAVLTTQSCIDALRNIRAMDYRIHNHPTNDSNHSVSLEPMDSKETSE